MQNRKPTADEVMAALETTTTVAEAAKQLGISRRTLYRRMGEYGIRLERVVDLKDAA